MIIKRTKENINKQKKQDEAWVKIWNHATKCRKGCVIDMNVEDGITKTCSEGQSLYSAWEKTI